jgi:hypothetical protein
MVLEDHGKDRETYLDPSDSMIG